MQHAPAVSRSYARQATNKEMFMLVEILVLAVSVAVTGGLVMRDTDTLPTSVPAAARFLLLSLIGSSGFVTLASLPGGG